MQFYRRNLPHMQRDNTPHFITFCTKFRQVLPDWARDIVLRCCVHDHESRYGLRVAVVMPDHVHIILTPLTDETRCTIISLVEIMKAIKGASAHAITRQAGNHASDGRRSRLIESCVLPRVWMQRSPIFCKTPYAKA